MIFVTMSVYKNSNILKIQYSFENISLLSQNAVVLRNIGGPAKKGEFNEDTVTIYAFKH